MKLPEYSDKSKHLSVEIAAESPNATEDDWCAAYVMTHVASGMFYVGSSGNMNQRRLQWLSYLRTGTCHHKKIQELHDADNRFHFKLYLTENRDEAYKLEQRFIDEHKGDPKCLNQALDATKPPPHRQHTEEAKRKISQAGMGRPPAASTLARILKANAERAMKVSIKGVVYGSLADAGRALNLSPVGISKKIKKGKHSDWKFV